METDSADLVRRWFNVAKRADGPLMPDGWFGGRPRENTFLLADVHSHEHSLELHLSEDTCLLFDHLGEVVVEENNLVFRCFRRAVLRWKHYGADQDAPMYERTYSDGQVVLAAPIGTKVDVR